MTLLTICQDALKEIGGFNVPETIVGNTDPTAVQLLALANRSGRELALDYKWEVLLETHTFSTADGTAAYALPADFHSIADGTAWDRTNDWRLAGPASKRAWEQFQSSAVTSSGLRAWFRIQGRQFNLYPTPSSVRSIAYEYYQNTFVSPAAGSDKISFTLDTDTARIDEDLVLLGVKYRFKLAKGLPHGEEKAEFENRKTALQSINKGAPVVDFRGGSYEHGIPETGFGA